ncbi:MAG: GIY-YIG nuclease family protein [Promethearchaeota archaeon]
MPLYYVYILKCENKKTKKISLYTGSTQDLMNRFEQHRKGRGAKYTRGKNLELVYFETFLTRSDVMKREYEIKTYSSSKKWELIHEFQQKIEGEDQLQVKK